MTATATQEPDLAALAADAERRLEELRPQRQRLALDALGDEQSAVELAGVESEIASAKRLLEQARLAGDERNRREVAAHEEAEAKRQAAAQKRADGLEVELQKAARSVDQGAGEFARAVASYIETQAELGQALNQAGNPGHNDRLIGSRFESALAHALSAAGVPRVIDLPPTLGRSSEPLAPEAK